MKKGLAKVIGMLLKKALMEQVDSRQHTLIHVGLHV